MMDMIFIFDFNLNTFDAYNKEHFFICRVYSSKEKLTDKKSNKTNFYLQYNFMVKPTFITLEDTFELQILVKDQSILQVYGIFNQDNPAYKNKNLPLSLLRQVRPQLFGHELISSPNMRLTSSASDSNKVSFLSETRSLQATKMWDRAVESKMAKYITKDDVYELL